MAARGSVVICDTCGAAEQLRMPTFESRTEEAKRLGWKFAAAGDGWLIACPACAEQEREAIRDAWPPSRRLAFIAGAARTARSRLTRALSTSGPGAEDAIRDAYNDLFDVLSRITLVATEEPAFLDRNAAALGVPPDTEDTRA